MLAKRFGKKFSKMAKRRSMIEQSRPLQVMDEEFGKLPTINSRENSRQKNATKRKTIANVRKSRPQLKANSETDNIHFNNSIDHVISAQNDPLVKWRYTVYSRTTTMGNSGCGRRGWRKEA